MAAAVVLTILTGAAGLGLVVAGVSLAFGTTRSPVARFIFRVAFKVEVDDLDAYLAQLFAAHAQAVPDSKPMSLDRYRRSLRAAGASLAGLGVVLLALLVYALCLLVRGA